MEPVIKVFLCTGNDFYSKVKPFHNVDQILFKANVRNIIVCPFFFLLSFFHVFGWVKLMQVACFLCQFGHWVCKHTFPYGQHSFIPIPMYVMLIFFFSQFLLRNKYFVLNIMNLLHFRSLSGIGHWEAGHWIFCKQNSRIKTRFVHATYYVSNLC